MQYDYEWQRRKDGTNYGMNTLTCSVITIALLNKNVEVVVNKAL
jgi:hypothetical protein